MIAWWWAVLALFVGAMVGMVIMALAAISGRAESALESRQRRAS